MSWGDPLKRASIRLLWFDSLGAKSSSIAVRSSDGYIVIDPGAAVMQPSYPLSSEEKVLLRSKAVDVIERYLIRAKAVIITHYHYDHHLLVGDPHFRRVINPYSGKLLILKNPNTYINASQWVRAREFVDGLTKWCGISMDDLAVEPREEEFQDPVEELREANSRDWGSYRGRRDELLRKGREWFRKLVRNYWSSKPWLREAELSDGTRIVWGDGRVFNFGDTTVRIMKPWFHGVEYDRTGWVTPVIIEKLGVKVFYSSDLMGPEIEDYAEEIIRERPHAIILDGPPTYLFPYMLNRINLERAVENASRIIREAEPKIVIYDHHLLREGRWRKRVSKVFKVAEEVGTRLITAAEYLRREVLIDKLFMKGC